jgi:DNA-directed RNA polymerase specialized sigma24 family protein
VTEPMSARYDADDARLLNMVRGGDSGAFGVLQERHEAAARRLARHLVASPYEIDDVVAQAFAWVLDVTSQGGGPSNAFRPYVLTAVRRVCYYRLTGEPTWQRTDLRARPEPGEPFVEPSMAGLERALIARAYLSLPERWRAVLWHAQVEQAPPADVAPLLGLTRNGVAALDRRATEGLRQAYLQSYLSTTSAPECRLVGERLAVFVRDPHAVADAAMVSAHLDGCTACRTIYAELADVGGALRAGVAPLVLGPAAAPYLFGPADGGATASSRSSSGRGAATAAAAGPAALAAPITGSKTIGTAVLRAVRLRRPPRPAHSLAALAILAVVAVIALVVFVSGGGAPTSARGPEHPAAAAAPTISATSAMSAAPAISATVPPPAPTAPTVPPSPSIIPPAVAPAPPPVSVDLTASLDLPAGLMFGHATLLEFQIANAGSAPTETVTVSISLPAGSSVFDWQPGGSGDGGWGGQGGSRRSASADGTDSTAFSPGGWDCQPTASGATCSHAAIAAGQQTEGFVLVTVSDSAACGQAIQLTVTSGPAFAQATQDLSC